MKFIIAGVSIACLVLVSPSHFIPETGDQDTTNSSGILSEDSYSWAPDDVEQGLPCELYDSCLHVLVNIDVPCAENLTFDLGFLNSSDRVLFEETVIAPSKSTDESIFEVGTNSNHRDLETFVVYQVSCSSQISNIIAPI